jgi:integrase
VIRVSAEKGANKRDRWLTEDEEMQLLPVCPSLLREVLVFALHSGMRLGEILALTWTGVDLFRKTVTVFHSKNGERRAVPMNHKSPMMTQRYAHHYPESLQDGVETPTRAV